MRRAAIAVSALLALAAGCGGGDPGDAFERANNEICVRFNEAYNSIPQPTAPDEAAAYARKILPATEQYGAEAAKLTPPDPQKDDFSAYVANLAGQVAVLRELERVRGRDEVIEVAGRLDQLDTEGHSQARGLGLSRCVSH